MKVVTLRIALLVLLALLSSACRGGQDSQAELVVAAASSLTDAFDVIASKFEDAHPDVDVVLDFAGSSTLREQILGGAPADVFASADLSNMDDVVAAGEISGPVEVFAHNLLQIAVPRGNPARVRGLDDFSDPDLLIGLCAEGVPCGEFARRALVKAGVIASIDTSEPDVRSLLTKIEAGELDAGITYLTDVASTHGAVDGVAIPADLNVTAEYPIAIVAGTDDAAGAAAFIDFVMSEEGQKILRQAGFASP